MNRLAVRLLLPAVAGALAAQSSIRPAEPRAGSPLELCYDTAAPGARFAPGDGVHAVVAAFTARGLETRAVELRAAPGESALRGTAAVPADACFVSCRFVTRTDWDRAADREAMVHDDSGPVRGARPYAVFSPGADLGAIIAAELAQYPDAFAAYRAKWFASSVRLASDDLRALVSADLATIGEAAGAEALWARSYGALLLGDEAAARPLVLELLAHHADGLTAERALSDYEYQVYAQGIGGDGPREVAAAKTRAIAAHPTSWLARQEIRVASVQEDFPLAVTRAVCEPWLRDEPRNPEPAYVLAEALRARGQDLDEAAALASRAAEGYLNGDARLCGDFAGSITKMMLAPAYRTAARIASARGRHAEALAFARAAQAVAHRTAPRYDELEAGIWEDLGDRGRAELAWARALCAGSAEARDALARLHLAAGRAQEDLDAHVAELIAKVDGGARPPAAAFDTHDLDGARVALGELRGRVVVLNFWSLGCAPCKVEIPDLSRLAADYRDAGVEFVAFATDAAEPLRAYLAEHPFAYRVVPAAGRIAAGYRVDAWPTHVVIDQRGRVAATLVGGGAGTDQRLRPLIDRLLAE